MVLQTNHHIIIGDSRQMDYLGDDSVQLVITSPPYWQLKDYGNVHQIGYHQNYETYINNLNLVWKECHRVLEKGCRLCVNIGDQFARSVYYGRYKVIPIRTEIIKFCESISFDYMGAIIWQKKITMNTTGGASLMGSYPYPRNGILSIDYEFILLFKKLGTPKKVNRENKLSSGMTKEEWKTYFQGHWNFGGVRQDGHIAMFPEELPHRLIKMFSFVGDNVLDPFLGSGTTILAAKKLERNSVGFEINAEFKPLIEKKIGIKTPEEGQHKINFYGQKLFTDFDNEIKKLPYIFKDYHYFDKKVDPKKQKFGSKLDNSSKSREDFYRVIQIISPEKLLISGNITIRLLGLKLVPEKIADAISFLDNKTKGQKVFIKFDREEYDSEGNLLCYLYLSNKTFLNAHLIKFGFASVDERVEHRHLNRFIRYQKEAKNG